MRPVFERRHYSSIAAVMRKVTDHYLSDGLYPSEVELVVNSLSSMFEEDNPRFDPRTFKRACGTEEK